MVEILQNEALFAIEAVIKEAKKRKKSLVVAIADSHGELIGLMRMDRAPLSSIVIAKNKAYTAARERKPSREIGNASKKPGTGFDIAYYGDSNIIGWGGGLPILKEGEVVGAIAVSGLSEKEDEELAKVGLDKITNTVDS